MPMTSTLLTAGRLAVSILIEDLRVIFAPSCRTVARLRTNANGACWWPVPCPPCLSELASVRSSAERLRWWREAFTI